MAERMTPYICPGVLTALRARVAIREVLDLLVMFFPADDETMRDKVNAMEALLVADGHVTGLIAERACSEGPTDAAH